ncbi:MAG: SBBP repeat-containing protein [Rhodospirillales bacterium]|nr:SBBP repeat-containing protein [Rhodospirillales bacterium]
MLGSNWTRRLTLMGGVLAVACCSVTATAMAQDKFVAWTRQVGTIDIDRADGVAADGAGNVYIAGLTYGSLAGSQQGQGDALVAKYDADGQVIWTRQLGTAAFDVAKGVATDGAGNVYLTGETEGSLGGTNSGGNDAWVAQYDTDGNVIWTGQLGTKADDVAWGVAMGAGNVYLCGSTKGSLGGAKKGGSDAWVAKYDADGQVIWTRQLGTAAYDVAKGVATDAAGNVYLTGETAGSLGGPANGGYDAWVAKYTANGDRLWKKQLGTAVFDTAYGVATDGAGNVYLAGPPRPPPPPPRAGPPGARAAGPPPGRRPPAPAGPGRGGGAPGRGAAGGDEKAPAGGPLSGGAGGGGAGRGGPNFGGPPRAGPGAAPPAAGVAAAAAGGSPGRTDRWLARPRQQGRPGPGGGDPGAGAGPGGGGAGGGGGPGGAPPPGPGRAGGPRRPPAAPPPPGGEAGLTD